MITAVYLLLIKHAFCETISHICHLKYMKIFNNIKNSVYSPEFYRSLQSQTFKSSLKYFTKFNLLISLFFAVCLSILLIPSVLYVVKPSNISEITNIIPADLEIIIKDGQLSSNVKEPYSLPISGKFIADKNGKNDITKSYKNFFTIDTQNDFNVAAFKESQTLAYLSKDYLIYQEKNGQIRMQPLKDVPDMVVSRSTFTEFIEKVIPFLKIFLVPIILIGLFGGFFALSFVSNIIFIAIMSLIVLLIQKVKNEVSDYKQIYKYGLHLVTAIIILNTVLFIVLGFGAPWYLDALLFVWLYYINLKPVTK